MSGIAREKARYALDEFAGNKTVQAALSALTGFDRSSDRVAPFGV